jgi:Putative MetA-pathway of phenol degradation
VKAFGGAALFIGLALYASSVHAQTANSQSDARDYDALAYLPKDTLVALTYFREVSSSDKESLTQTQGIFRASYVLKFGNLAIVPFDAILPVVDVAVYAPVPMQPGLTTTLHTSGLADLTYLPTIGYVIPENETTHTVIAATAYVTGPSGSYDASRLVNIGDNRWRIQPQVGVSQRFLKVATFDLIGSLAFYTTNTAFPTPQGFVTMKQNQTFGLEAHAAVDLSPDFYVSASYYLAAIGERDVEAPPVLPLSTYEPEQTVQSVRFSFGIRAEKATLLLLQYNQDIEETGGATISRFIGARLSHAIFF